MPSNVVTLHYSEQGQGIPVVLLHGYPLNSSIWAEQQESLSDHYRVITPDLRGHGQSPAPEGVYGMDVLAGDVLALLDSLNIRRAVIMGHSMGGYVTLALWKRAPERFIALGLISSQAGADNEETRQGRYTTAGKVLNEGSGVVADAMVPKLFAPGFPKDDSGKSIQDQVRSIILNTRPTGIIGALKGMATRPDSTDFLPNITIPAFILAGDKDQIIPIQKVEAMASALTNATLVVVEDAGHMAMMEQPRATTMAMRNFLMTMGH